jgi:hypothetical protein
MGKQPLGALSKLLLMPAAIPELTEDLPNVQRGEVYDGDHDVLQFNVKFASLREQDLFYGDIPDDDPIDYHDVDVGQGSPEELADAIQGLLTSAEQAGMSRDGVQSLRQLMTECKDVFRLKLGADSRANVKPLVIKLRDGAEPVWMSARKYAPPQLKFSDNPSEARARPVPHDCRSACTERVRRSQLHGLCLTFRMSCTTCMAQKYSRR